VEVVSLLGGIGEVGVFQFDKKQANAHGSDVGGPNMHADQMQRMT
jgi:hypothetical protein